MGIPLVQMGEGSVIAHCWTERYALSHGALCLSLSLSQLILSPYLS